MQMAQASSPVAGSLSGTGGDITAAKTPHSDAGTDGAGEPARTCVETTGDAHEQGGVNLLKKRLEETPSRALKLAQSDISQHTFPAGGCGRGGDGIHAIIFEAACQRPARTVFRLGRLHNRSFYAP